MPEPRILDEDIKIDPIASSIYVNQKIFVNIETGLWYTRMDIRRKIEKGVSGDLILTSQLDTPAIYYDTCPKNQCNSIKIKTFENVGDFNSHIKSRHNFDQNKIMHSKNLIMLTNLGNRQNMPTANTLTGDIGAIKGFSLSETEQEGPEADAVDQADLTLGASSVFLV